MKAGRKKIIFTELIAAILAAIVLICNWKCKIMFMDYEVIREYQNTIITISSVFAGFSFTVLGLLISLSSTNIMEKLEETSEMSDKCITITNSILMFVIATICSLVYIFFLAEHVELLIANQILLISLFYIFGGILLFVKSVFNMILLMECIFDDNRKRAKKKISEYNSSVEKIRDQMKNNLEDDY